MHKVARLNQNKQVLQQVNKCMGEYKNIILLLYLMKSSLIANPDLDTILPVCCVPLIRISRILFFEFFAAFIVTFGTMVSYGNPKIPQSVYAQCAFVALSVFFAFVVSGQVSGGQANPVITLSLIFTRGSNVSALNSIVYIISQFIGSIVAGAVAYGTINYSSTFPDPTNYALTMGSQILGSFMFITLYLIIMSTSTKMESNFWCYILVPCAYYISCMLSMQYTGLNPASILADQLFYGVKTNNYTPLSTYWVYFCGPLIGGLVASLLFNFFLLPIHKALSTKQKVVN